MLADRRQVASTSTVDLHRLEPQIPRSNLPKSELRPIQKEDGTGSVVAKFHRRNCDLGTGL